MCRLPRGNIPFWCETDYLTVQQEIYKVLSATKKKEKEKTNERKKKEKKIELFADFGTARQIKLLGREEEGIMRTG